MKKAILILIIAASFVSCKKKCWECQTPCGVVKVCEVDGKRVDCTDGNGTTTTTFCTEP